MITFRRRQCASCVSQDTLRTFREEAVGGLPTQFLGCTDRPLELDPDRSRPVCRDDDAGNQEVVSTWRMRVRADGHLTSAAEPIHDSAFGSQRHRRTGLRDGGRTFSRTIVALSNLDGNDALTWRGHAQLNREQGGDSLSSIQTTKSGCGQHESIIVARIQFPETRIQVSSNRQKLAGGRQAGELRDSTNAASSDPGGSSKQLPDVIEVLMRILARRKNDRVARILAGEDAADLESVRQERRHVLAAVNSHVHLAGEQGVLDFLHEQSLPPNLGE